MHKSRSALQALTPKTLEDENRRYTGRGGISEENRGLGFLPAYLDSATGSIHLSCFRDGRRAPIHLLDGLPEPLVLGREASGKIVALKGSVSAGFVREGRFYTREQAAMAMMREARDGNSPSSPRPVQASLSRSWAGILLL
ncbi:MAG: hypothetical protein L0Z68_02045 [Gammaproteobacteria bacterium]|nr:hypothetical protein [Gammaproteobacteria bacterium]